MKIRCGSIIQVIGADLENHSTSKRPVWPYYLMSDADVDGAHIRCLLLTLMYFMRPPIDSPYLRRSRRTASKLWWQKGQYIYTYSDDEMQNYVI